MKMTYFKKFDIVIEFGGSNLICLHSLLTFTRFYMNPKDPIGTRIKSKSTAGAPYLVYP